jgi:hypothetical protein
MTGKHRAEQAKQAIELAAPDTAHDDDGDPAEEHSKPTYADEHADLPGGEPETPRHHGGPGGMDPGRP